MPFENILTGAWLTVNTDLTEQTGESSSTQDTRWFNSNLKSRLWVHSERPYVQTNDYTVSKGSVEPSPYSAEEDHLVTPWNSSSTGHGTSDLTNLLQLVDACDPTNTLAAAQNSAILAVRDATWSSPVAIAEAGKTISSVQTLTQKVTKGAAILKKLKRNPKRALKEMRELFYRTSSPATERSRIPQREFSQLRGTGDVAKAWLIYRYEIMTTVMDIQSAAQVAADLLLPNKPEVHRVEQRRTTVVELPTVSHTYGFPGEELVLHLYVPHTAVRTAIAEITCKAWLRVRRENPILSEMEQLGLLNWPSNLWELTPLSFVADWVLNLGTYLESMTALSGYVVEDSGYSVYRRVGGVISASALNGTFNVVRTLTMEPIRYEVSKYERLVWPNPAASWIPALRLSTSRLIDAAALIRGTSRVKL